MKKISIIIPIYNVEEMVLGCLKSIRAQSFTDFECLCIDDGSKDRSAELVADYIADDARFSLIRQQNKGVGGARNTGLALATGEWITFVDSDDYLHPQALEMLLEAGEREGVEIVGAGSKKTRALYTPISASLKTVRAELITDPFARFIRKKLIHTAVWGKLYRRSFINNHPFSEGVFYEDTPWTTEMMVRCRCYARLDVPLYYYYENCNSIMRSDWTVRKTDEFVLGIRDIYESAQHQRPERLGELRELLLSPLLQMLFNRIQKSSKELRPELWDHARPHIRNLFQSSCIGYKGLKLKHKIRLWLLLR